MLFPKIAALGLIFSSFATAAIKWPSLEFTPVGPAVSLAVAITNAGDGSGRIFITQKTGLVRILSSVSATTFLTTPFLDVSSKVATDSERGLLSIAFPPNYATSHHFYAFYVRSSDGALTISRFGLTSNADVADSASEEVLLTIPHPGESNHNGGQLQFGPDGLLYISTGDGGGGGDQPNNAQNKNVLLGKILRIDVEGRPDVGLSYAIPTDNPFVGKANTKPEIWAYGLRNTWRFSFDRQTGDLYLADVGQDKYEEVDFQRAGAAGGQNYGWRLREGNHNYNNPAKQLAGLKAPVLELSHAAGYESITGGYVYRGPASLRLDGKYILADFVSGVVRALVRNGNGVWKSKVVAQTGWNISTFGETEDGTLLLSRFGDSDGQIYQISDAPLPTASTGSGSTIVTGGTLTTGSSSSSSGSTTSIGSGSISVLGNSTITFQVSTARQITISTWPAGKIVAVLKPGAPLTITNAGATIIFQNSGTTDVSIPDLEADFTAALAAGETSVEIGNP